NSTPARRQYLHPEPVSMPTPMVFAAALLLALPPTAEQVNEKIAPAAVVGLDGKPATLSAGAGATVVVFLSFDCPVSCSYAATLADVAKTYADRGVTVVGVCPTDDPAATVKKRCDEFKIAFPVYLDPKSAAVAAVKATTTPEAFVLDKDSVLRYRGRI